MPITAGAIKLRQGIVGTPGDASNIGDASNGVGRAVWNFNLLLTVTSIIYFCWPVGPIGFLHVTFISVSFTV